MSAEAAHSRIAAIAAEVPPGLLLDIPAGSGPVRDRLAAHGHRIVEVDLFARPGMHGVCADACAPLPFRDGSFDVVLSMEGIEHFENPASFLRECSRVLRPGGRLLLTTPNVLHLSSRLSYFLTGQRLAKQGFLNEVTTLRGGKPDRPHHGHAFLIDAFRLRYLLALAGMRLDRVETTNVSSGSRWLSPLYPLIWLATRYAIWSGRRHRQKRKQSVPGAAIEAELRSLATASALLFSRGLIVVATRLDGSPAFGEPNPPSPFPGGKGEFPIRNRNVSLRSSSASSSSSISKSSGLRRLSFRESRTTPRMRTISVGPRSGVQDPFPGREKGGSWVSRIRQGARFLVPPSLKGKGARGLGADVPGSQGRLLSMAFTQPYGGTP